MNKPLYKKWKLQDDKYICQEDWEYSKLELEMKLIFNWSIVEETSKKEKRMKQAWKKIYYE